MNTTLTIRTSKIIKDKAAKILQKRGLNLSLFINQNLRVLIGNSENKIENEELTISDFVAYKKAIAEYKKGDYISMQDYEVKRFGKTLTH